MQTLLARLTVMKCSDRLSAKRLVVGDVARRRDFARPRKFLIYPDLAPPAAVRVRRTSKKSVKLRTGGQDLLVFAHRQTVFPAHRDGRSVALPTRVVADPLERCGGNTLVEEPVHVPGVARHVAHHVVVHQRIDTVRIAAHQAMTTNHVASYRPTVQRRLGYHPLFSRLNRPHTRGHRTL